MPADGHARLTAIPERGFDVGAGRGRPYSTEVRGGVVGFIVDARGRQPFVLPTAAAERIARLRAWNQALELYPGRS